MARVDARLPAVQTVLKIEELEDALCGITRSMRREPDPAVEAVGARAIGAGVGVGVANLTSGFVGAPACGDSAQPDLAHVAGFAIALGPCLLIRVLNDARRQHTDAAHRRPKS